MGRRRTRDTNIRGEQTLHWVLRSDVWPSGSPTIKLLKNIYSTLIHTLERSPYHPFLTSSSLCSAFFNAVYIVDCAMERIRGVGPARLQVQTSAHLQTMTTLPSLLLTFKFIYIRHCIIYVPYSMSFYGGTAIPYTGGAPHQRHGASTSLLCSSPSSVRPCTTNTKNRKKTQGKHMCMCYIPPIYPSIQSHFQSAYSPTVFHITALLITSPSVPEFLFHDCEGLLRLGTTMTSYLFRRSPT